MGCDFCADSALDRQLLQLGTTRSTVDARRAARGLCPVAELELPHLEAFLQWLLRHPDWAAVGVPAGCPLVGAS